jgi:cytochrome c556
MDLMAAMNKEMKSVNQRIASNRNLASIADSAARIKEMSGDIAGKFPSDSLTPPTDAKPAIWTQWNQFEARIEALQVSLDRLAAAAPSSDPKLVSDEFKAVAHGCNACHDDFRKKGH